MCIRDSSVSLETVIRDHSLEALYLPKAASDLYISSYDVNRPGLILTGYKDVYKRQLMKKSMYATIFMNRLKNRICTLA